MPILSTRLEYSGEYYGTWKQNNVIKKLFELSNEESIVCATDAGREGEGTNNIYESFVLKHLNFLYGDFYKLKF